MEDYIDSIEDEALLQQAAVASLQKPNPQDLAFLQQWMVRPSMGNVYLLGQDSDTWSKPDEWDLIALQARYAGDPFTTWVHDSLVHWWHRCLGKYVRVCSTFTPLPVSASYHLAHQQG